MRPGNPTVEQRYQSYIQSYPRFPVAAYSNSFQRASSLGLQAMSLDRHSLEFQNQHGSINFDREMYPPLPDMPSSSSSTSSNELPPSSNRRRSTARHASGAHPSFMQKSVVKLTCRYCERNICHRGMKAILLADTKVELYSTDTIPDRG